MRKALRLLLAITVGYVAFAVIVIVGTATAAAVHGLAPESVPTPGFLLTGILIGLLAAAVGGYVCAGLAPAGRVLVTVAGLVVLVLAVSVLSVRAAANTQPIWYVAMIALFEASGVMIGGVIRANAAAREIRPAG